MQLHTDTCQLGRDGLHLGWGWSRPAVHSAARLSRGSPENRQGSTALVDVPPRRTIRSRHDLLHVRLVDSTTTYPWRRPYRQLGLTNSNAPCCTPLHLLPSFILEQQDHELSISKLHSCALRGRRASPSSQVKSLDRLELRFPRLLPPSPSDLLIISGDHVFAGTRRPVPFPSEAQEEAEARQTSYCGPSCSRRSCQGRCWDLIRGLVRRSVSTPELW